MAPLERSRDDRIVLGVCGGLAESLRISTVWLRLSFVVLAFGWGIGLLLYVVLALVMYPPREAEDVPFWSRVGLNFKLARREILDVGENLSDAWRMWRERRTADDLRVRVRAAIGGVALLLGLALLLGSFGLFGWLTTGRTLALVLMFVGIGLVAGSDRFGSH